MTEDSADSDQFAIARELISAAAFREDFAVREIPAPQGLAPHAIAFAGDVRPDEDGDSTYGTGRIIVLHDPEGQEGWDGQWRIVCFGQAPLETEIGTDPFLAEVAWSWLTDALASHDAAYTAISGTATKTLSRGFGSLAEEGDGAQIELRASWSPTGNIGGHVQAWAELVCMLAGLPPGSERIAVFGAKKGRA